MEVTMKKVLYGEHYTQARFCGIKHEARTEMLGRPVNIGETLYSEGQIKTNAITNEIGLVVDTESQYFGLTEPHLSRLVDVVEGDGWMDEIVE